MNSTERHTFETKIQNLEESLRLEKDRNTMLTAERLILKTDLQTAEKELRHARRMYRKVADILSSALERNGLTPPFARTARRFFEVNPDFQRKPGSPSFKLKEDKGELS